MKRTIVGAISCVSMLVAVVAQAGIPEPDVILHGQLSIDGVQVVPGRKVQLVARVDGQTELVAVHDYGAINLNDCNINGLSDNCDLDCGESGGPCDFAGCGTGVDLNGDGILDECNRYRLRLRIEHSIAGEPDDPNSAHIGDVVEILAIDADNLSCSGGDNGGETCTGDSDCPGGTCSLPRETLLARMHIGDAGAIFELDLGSCGTAVMSSRVYVDADAKGGGDGTRWADAYGHPQLAFDARACVGRFLTEIWVAKGTYVPTAFTNRGDPRTAHFTLASGLGLYGGFAGFEQSLDQRDVLAHETILSGDLNGDDRTGGTNNDNAYHVLRVSGAVDGALLDGFVITGGNADKSGTEMQGGGALISGASPTFRDCTFRDNWATHGGGLYVADNCAPVLDRCHIINNHADEGAGVYTENQGNPTLTHCRMSGNVAGGGAAAMSNRSNSKPIVINCLINNNQGDAIMNDGGSVVTLINSTVSGNTGWGVRSESGASATISNTVLWDNGLGQVSGAATVSYSCVQGGFAGDGNIDVDPQFLTPSNGNYRITHDSFCVDAGNNSLVPPALTVDLDGSPRVFRNVVDIGAYEEQVTGQGDADGDGNVNVDDHAAFAACMFGPKTTPRPADPLSVSLCRSVFDSDADADVDLMDFDDFTEQFGRTAGNCAGSAAINLEDFAPLSGCMTGPEGGLAPGCTCADIDRDRDVDMRDYSEFLSLFGP